MAPFSKASATWRSVDGHLGVVDQRAEVVPVARAHLQVLDVTHHGGDELVVDRFEHVHPLDGHARLAGVEERAPYRGVGGQVDVGVLEHDHRVLAAEFQADRGEPAGGALGDLRTGGRRAGELDVVGVVDDGLDGLPGALNDRHDLGGARVRPPAQQQFCGQRGALGWLEQHCAARRQRGDAVHQEVGHGVVPRRDDGDDGPRPVVHRDLLDVQEGQ